MIIWSGVGILIPLVAVFGIIVGSVLGGALGMPVVGAGFGFLLAAAGNWGLWKLVYPKTPRILVDPATGRQVVQNPKHGLFFIPAKAWTWILAILAVPAIVIGIVGEKAAAADAAKPGYSQFKAANDLIDSKRNGETHGNTEVAKSAAAEFSSGMKAMTEVMFSGGSKKNLMTGGTFLTYCHDGPDTIVFLCHVPSLRNYKSDESREGLNKIAWSVASEAASSLDPSHKKTLMVGLRGVTSYGSIQQGPPDAPTLVSDDTSMFYTVFAATVVPKSN
jgi:hypothetical protein